MSSFMKKTPPIAMAVASDPSRVPASDPRSSDGSVIKDGVLRKLKTNKKKFFVLKSQDEVGPARLEYYDSYKKWSTGQPPKKSIYLEDCFKICRRIDTKNKMAIGLYLRDSTFSVVCDDEDTLQDWLQHLLEVKYGGEDEPNNDQVWDVSVKCKLKEDNGKVHTGKAISGAYRFILRSDSILLSKVAMEPEVWNFEVPAIRSCADGSVHDTTFFMELGHRSPLGPCELSFQTEEASIARNLHQIVANYLRGWKKDPDAGGDHRERLCSSASSKSGVRRHTSMSSRHSLAGSASGSGFSTPVGHGSGYQCGGSGAACTSAGSVSNRVRADTMPTQRAPRSRTTSEGGFARLSVSHVGGGHAGLMACGGGAATAMGHVGGVGPGGAVGGVHALHHGGPASTVAATAPAAPSALVGSLAAFGLSSSGRPPSFHGSSGGASSYGVCGRSVFSASPPITNSPLSPSSGHCSDSAGSSLSVDADFSDVDLAGSAGTGTVGRHHGAGNPYATAAGAGAAHMSHHLHHVQHHHHLHHLHHVQHHLSHVPGGDLISVNTAAAATVITAAAAANMNAAVITTQPPIIEENPDAGSGEYVTVSNPASGEDNYIPFDPEKRVLKRFIPRSPAPPTSTSGMVYPACCTSMACSAACIGTVKSPSPPDLLLCGPLPKSPSPTPPPLPALSSSSAQHSVVSSPASEYLEMSPCSLLSCDGRTPVAASVGGPTAPVSVAGSAAADDNYLAMMPLSARVDGDSAGVDDYLDMTASSLARSRGEYILHDGTATSTPSSVHNEERIWHIPPGSLIQHHNSREDAVSISSVHSIHSGSLSNDPRFGEYHPDKMYSLVLHDELLDHPEMRPRTQSTGSHIEKGKKMTRTAELQAIAAGQRIRAHSMGSQMPKWKKGARRLFDGVIGGGGGSVSGASSLRPPSSQHSITKMSPSSSAASSSAALHGTSPVSKSWSGPGQYFKLMGATISHKVSGGRHDPHPSTGQVPMPVQPTSAQLAKDETLRFFFKKRHSLDHTSCTSSCAKTKHQLQRQPQVAPTTVSSTDIDYGWMDIDPTVAARNPFRTVRDRANALALRMAPSAGLPVSADVTPEMAVAAVSQQSSSSSSSFAVTAAGSASASASGQDPGNGGQKGDSSAAPPESKVTPSVMLCQNWLAAHHEHLESKIAKEEAMKAMIGGAITEEDMAKSSPGDDYLPMIPLSASEYQSAPNSAPPMSNNAPPDWSAPLRSLSPTSSLAVDKGSDYVNLDPAELAKLSPFILAARERAAAKANERPKQPLPSFLNVVMPKTPSAKFPETLPISIPGAESIAGSESQDSDVTITSAAVNANSDALDDGYLVMTPKPHTSKYSRSTRKEKGKVQSVTCTSSDCPGAKVDVAAVVEKAEPKIFTVSTPRRGSFEELEEETELVAMELNQMSVRNGDVSKPPPSAASVPLLTNSVSLLRNMVCSPVVEEDWANLSQESMNHIINDFTLSEKCEVDATSGSLRIVNQSSGDGFVVPRTAATVLAGMLKVSSSPLLRSCSSASSNCSATSYNGERASFSSQSPSTPPAALTKKKSRHRSEPVNLTSTGKIGLFPLTREDLLKPLNKPFKKIKGVLRSSNSPKQQPSSPVLTNGASSFSSQSSAVTSVGERRDASFLSLASGSDQGRTLNYAQLDLPCPSGGGPGDGGSSASVASPNSSSASLGFYSASSVTAANDAVSYAQIDFKKSEGLRNTSMSLHRGSK